MSDEVLGQPFVSGVGTSGHDAASAEESNTDPATNAPRSVPPAPEPSREEFADRARLAGWTEATAYNYDQFTRAGGSDATFHGNAARYEWQGEYGDVGPENPALLNELFGGEFQMRRGEHLQQLELEVTVAGEDRIVPVTDFNTAGLHPVVIENLRRCGYEKPTAIQRYTIPAVLSGIDVVAISQTGSGKTAAYMIPIVSKLMGRAQRLQAPRPAAGIRAPAQPLVVIVVPTRELAIQIFDEARRMCYRSMLRPCVSYGGLPMANTRDDLGRGCDVLIATPGRLCALMDDPRVLIMSRIKYTVIDEADEMLGQDWTDELAKIMAGGDANEDADHVFLMFSATFPAPARVLSREYMAQDHVRITVGRPGSAHRNIHQDVVFVDGHQKQSAVYDLLLSSEPSRTLIFCNSRHQVDLLDDFLYNRRLPTTSIHSDRNQREREGALRAFRTGEVPILIATGVSSRGWDIPDVNHVINYDLPSGMYGGIQEYVHRIGRTARIGHQGRATSFYNDRNEDIAQGLVNVLVESGCTIPDFLSQFTPEDVSNINFDDNSDDEAEADGPGFGGGAGGEEGGDQEGDTGFQQDASAVPAADW